MIEINLSLLYQIAGFFILYFILNAILYKPVLKTIEERDENITGPKKAAEALDAELQKMLLEYEKRLNEAKAKAQEERHRIRQEGVDKEAELLDAARKNAQDSLMNAKEKLKNEVGSAITQLKEESKTISRNIAEKMIGRKVA